MPDKWYVYKRTTSNVCTAQLETSLPHLGVQHLGPFDTKDQAIKAMCADIDDSASDQGHCWAVSPADACDHIRKEAWAANSGSDFSPLVNLPLDQIRTLVSQNNNSPFTDELVISICWAESSFDPDAVAGGGSTSAGLMMMNHGAIDTVNHNTPEGTHFEYSDMSDPAKAIACGSWYLQVIYNNAGNGNKRETVRIYRGAGPGDYTYADKVISCESCLQSTVVPDPKTCLNMIHS